MKKHIHADMMLAYAQDAQESDTPWNNWEYQRDNEKEWKKCCHHPEWDVTRSYRRRIKTIRINGYDVPEPLREKPKTLETYYFVSFREGNNVHSYCWSDDSIDNQLLSNGVVHKTLEAAKLHAKALISLTKL